LKRKIVGQDHVIDAFAKQLKRRVAMVQLARGNIKNEKPLGVFLFAGPPGSGKTNFAKVLAENMYNGKNKLLFLDMVQYRHAHELGSLVGTTLDYVGGVGGLTSALEQNPRLIVLLDGIEKAGAEAIKLFLAAWADGFITDVRTSKRVDITKALFLLTTNASWEQLVEIDKTIKDDHVTHQRSVMEALKQAGLAPELFSRIDHTFVFHPLSLQGMACLAALEIRALAVRYKLEVTKIDPHYVFEIVAADRGKDINPRDLMRVIDRDLGDLYLQATQAGANTVEVVFEDGKPAVKIVPTSDGPPAS